MARFVFGMNVSLDGFVDHDRFGTGPDPVLFRHYIDLIGGLSGSVYGRTLYEIMRYWDTDDPNWPDPHRDFALAWRAMPKWVVSSTLAEVGPNATLIASNPESTLRRLKDQIGGEVDVGGPRLARALAEWGLIDAYHLYVLPWVLGHGTPFFAGGTPRLRLLESRQIGPDCIRLAYAPAGNNP